MDQFFIELHNFQAIIEQVKNQPFLTIVGSPGSGKSVMAYHIAFALQKDGYDILQINDIRDIVHGRNRSKRQVFVLEDFLGVFGLRKDKLSEMLSHESKIRRLGQGQSKILMTCREVVFNQISRNELKSYFLLGTENIIRLHSDKYALNNQDKLKLLEKYSINVKFSEENLKRSSTMFPLICYLCSRKRELEIYGPKFFEIPHCYILETLDELKVKEKLQYAALVLLAVNENRLSKEKLDDPTLQSMKRCFLEKCEVKTLIDSFEIIHALLDMTGTYTKQINDEYSFFHDSLLEIVAYHFGTQFQELILNHMDSVYIANYMKPETCELQSKMSDKSLEFNLRITIKQSLYSVFAERLFKDIERLNLYEVFSNSVLKHHPICREVMNVLRSKTYKDITSLFLSEQRDVSKLVTRNEQMKDDKEKHTEFHIERVLMDERYALPLLYERTDRYIDKTPPLLYSIKVVSWVIYYGHNQLLQYILDQMKKHTGNENDMFKKTYTSVHECFYYLKNVERIRLFFLACCSGDVKTVTIMLRYVTHEEINMCPTTCVITKRPNYLSLGASCRLGHVDVVKKLLENGADVNQHSELFGTPLVAACTDGHIALISVLLTAGANINLCAAHHTPLTAACEGRHFEIVNKLFEEGADINKNNRFFESPLTVACNSNYLDKRIIDFLLEKGAEVNPPVAYSTPLVYACQYGHLDLVEKFLEIGASVNLENTKESPITTSSPEKFAEIIELGNTNGSPITIYITRRTPIQVACESGNVKIVRALLTKGAHCQPFKNLVKMICSVGDISLLEDISSRVKTKKTPLHHAIEGGYTRVILELLKSINKINLFSCDLPLSLACISGCENMVKKILESYTYNVPSSEYMSKLMIRFLISKDAGIFDEVLLLACSEENVDFAQKLIRFGVNVNTVVHSRSPLKIACETRQISLIKMLINEGATVNELREEKTPMTIACGKGFCDVVQILLERKADPTLQDELDTPLTAACKGGYVDVVSLLIKNEVDVNAPGTFDTPLTAACKYGHDFVVAELIKYKANVNLSGKFNTPLTAASFYGHLNVVKILIDNMADVNTLGNIDFTTHTKGISPSDLELNMTPNPPVNYTPLTAACKEGHTFVVEEILKAKPSINKMDHYESPLLAACRHGYAAIVNKLLNAGAKVNLKNAQKKTALQETLKYINDDRLQILKMLSEHDADYSINEQFFQQSLLFALVHHNFKVVRVMLKSENEHNKRRKNAILYDVFVKIRKVCVKSKSVDDLYSTCLESDVWCRNNTGIIWKTITQNNAYCLSQLICFGLDVNQKLQIFQKVENDFKPILFVLIDEDICYNLSRIKTLLKAGVNLCERVKYKGYKSLLDKGGVTALERTRRLVVRLSDATGTKSAKDVSELKKVLTQIKKHSRRYSM